MADENAGSAWYELGTRDDKLREGLNRANQEIKRAGEQGERAFATPLERATGRVSDGVDDIAKSLNSLSGRSPKELADQLNRAEREAEEAHAAIRKIAQADDLSPADAKRYADALDEIGVEADQTVAELRELQKADPRFDTDELNRAASLIDKVGDEAAGTAGELRQLGRSDTHLEGVARKAKEAGRELDNAGDRGKRFGDSLGKLKGIIVGLGVAFGLREAIGKMNEMVDAASGLAEAQSKVDVVFGESSKEIDAWAANSAEAFGQSKRSALEAAGTYGNLLQAFGVAQPKAVEMSTTLVQLAADLASFNNTSVDEALDALRSGLSGETEPLKRYGVAINDVRLKEQALAMGLIETATGTLPVAVKAQAAYALILKDTALAQGDFARTSDGYANQQRILAAEMENVMAEIGEDLLPLWKDLIGFLRDPGIPIIREIAQEIRSIAAGAAIAADGISDFVRTLQIRVGELGKTIEDRANEIGVDVVEMKELVRTAMNDMGMDIDDAMEFAEQRLAGLPYHMTDAGMRSIAAWKQADLPNVVGADMAATAEAAENAGVEDAIATPFENARDRSVQAVRETFSEIAAEIALRESQLRAAGGDAVQAWFDPQVWANQAQVVKAELVTANEELLEAQRNGTKAEVAEAKNRVLQLTQQAIELEVNLATTGTEMEQAAKIRALATSDFMIAGLASRDPEIRALFTTWFESLNDAADELEGTADTSGKRTSDLMYDGLHSGSGRIRREVEGWGENRPDTSWARPSGERIGADFLAGLTSYYARIRQASIDLGEAAATGIRLRSPAKEGALSEPAGTWSRKLLSDWLGPLWAAVPDAERVSLALGGALAAHLQPDVAPAVAGIPRGNVDGGDAGGRTQIFHLYFEGQQRTVDSPFAAVEEAQRMGVFEG